MGPSISSPLELIQFVYFMFDDEVIYIKYGKDDVLLINLEGMYHNHFQDLQAMF